MPRLESFKPIRSHEFRLLLIYGCRDDEPIRGQLGIFDFTDCPSYLALSYVWGKRSQDRSIEIKGLGSVPVTDNLYAALRRLQPGERNCMPFWIDSICIDQESESEKNSQISKMRDIYSRAGRVAIWLGEPAPEDNQLLKDSLRLIFNLASVGPDSPSPMVPWSLINASRETLNYMERSIFKAPWFERAWTFQEAIVAKEAFVVFGENRFFWSTLMDFVNVMNGSLQFLNGLMDLERLTAFGRASKLYRGAGSLSLSPLMFTRRGCKATDPKDIVYAHIGLTTIGRESMPVDYAMSVEKVYGLFTKLLIRHEQNLDALSAVFYDDRKSGMPSWTIDWRVPVTRNPIATMIVDDEFREQTVLKPKYCASGSFQMMEQSLSWDHLELRGKRITRISKVYSPCLESEILGGMPMACSKWFEEFQQSFPVEDTYQWYPETYLDAFSRTLIADADHYTSYENHRADEEVRTTLAFLYNQQCPPESDFSKFLEEIGTAEGSWNERMRKYLRMVNLMCAQRRFFIGENGCMGLVPHEAQEGDEICVLFGAEVCFVLRPKDADFEFVGEAYCHAFMDSEVTDYESPIEMLRLV